MTSLISQMRIKAVVLTMAAAAVFSSIGLCSRTPDDDEIRAAVEAQLSSYPESTLRDLYKSFFQDRLGPAHLLADTAAAGAYLREELASREHFAGPYYEGTGAEANHYRVNLSVVKEGLVPYETFLAAFVESARPVGEKELRQWIREWESIEAAIDGMNLGLPDYEADRAAIKQLLDSGGYALSHSPAYRAAYDPHYRVVSRDVFERRIRELIE